MQNKVVVKDLREEFAADFLFPMLQSGAVYEKRYLLGIDRPSLIAKWRVAIAEEEVPMPSRMVPPAGNDQVRFELTYKALNPALTVVAPWRGVGNSFA